MSGKKVGNWIQKSNKTQYSNNWISLEHHEVINPNGGEGIYGVVKFKNFAVGVIPLDTELNTWIVGQHRYPHNKFTWEIPEGGGPLDIAPQQSAKRELQEEVGLEAKSWELIQELDLSNSVSDEVAFIYLATDLKQVDVSPDETEQLEVRKIPFVDVYNMVLKGEITDAMSVAGVLRLATILTKKGHVIT